MIHGTVESSGYRHSGLEVGKAVPDRKCWGILVDWWKCKNGPPKPYGVGIYAGKLLGVQL